MFDLNAGASSLAHTYTPIFTHIRMRLHAPLKARVVVANKRCHQLK